MFFMSPLCFLRICEQKIKFITSRKELINEYMINTTILEDIKLCQG